VFLHNLAPGAVERLGLSYDDCRARNPRLVWCGISGYGPDGPFRDRKAYDLLVQAESGVVSLTGAPDTPAKVGVSMADIAAGMYAYASTLVALMTRQRTGIGDRIDISMLECLTEWVTPALYVWEGTGRAPARVGVRHAMIVPYGAYACADGSVILAIQNDREWRRFCEQVLEDAAVADDPRFVSNASRVRNRVSLETLVEKAFAQRTRRDLLETLERADIPTATMSDMAAVASHPQLAARERWMMVRSSTGAMINAPVPPHNLKSVPPRSAAVPALGEHTAEVLAELGLQGS